MSRLTTDFSVSHTGVPPWKANAKHTILSKAVVSTDGFQNTEYYNSIVPVFSPFRLLAWVAREYRTKNGTSVVLTIAQNELKTFEQQAIPPVKPIKHNIRQQRIDRSSACITAGSVLRPRYVFGTAQLTWPGSWLRTS